LRNAPAEKAKVATIRVVIVPFPNPSFNSPIVSVTSRLKLNDYDGVAQIGANSLASYLKNGARLRGRMS
jgi:hypothetical protein